MNPQSAICNWYGAVAQLVEHHVRNVGVSGSIPLCSTKYAGHFLSRNCSTGRGRQCKMQYAKDDEISRVLERDRCAGRCSGDVGL